jgi:hypothetical protein
MDLSNIDSQAIAQTVGGSLPAISVFLDKFGSWFGWLKQPVLTIANAQANSLAKQIEAKGDIEVQRTQIRGIARLAGEAERTQKRLDAIGLKAMSQFLPDAKPQELKQDWMENFISHAAKAGDEDAETLWARILAGEVNKPGSYSKRTLDVLSLMTQQEAELFVKAGQYAVSDGRLIIVPRDQSFFPPDSGLNYYSFMELAALGLFHEAESQFNRILLLLLGFGSRRNQEFRNHIAYRAGSKCLGNDQERKRARRSIRLENSPGIYRILPQGNR